MSGKSVMTASLRPTHSTERLVLRVLNTSAPCSSYAFSILQSSSAWSLAWDSRPKRRQHAHSRCTTCRDADLLQCQAIYHPTIKSTTSETGARGSSSPVTDCSVRSVDLTPWFYGSDHLPLALAPAPARLNWTNSSTLSIGRGLTNLMPAALPLGVRPR